MPEEADKTVDAKITPTPVSTGTSGGHSGHTDSKRDYLHDAFEPPKSADNETDDDNSSVVLSIKVQPSSSNVSDNVASPLRQIKSKSSEESGGSSTANNSNSNSNRSNINDTLHPEDPDLLEEEDYTALYEQHNWLLVGIKDPHQNDVLYGRGGGTNHHPGNKRYRQLVEERKIEYVNSKRLEKPLVALDIIRKWRKEQVPPGRFLKVNESTGLWDDVGDKKAREKTSQALREKAPILRKQCQEEEDEQQLSADPPTAPPHYNHHLHQDVLYSPHHHYHHHHPEHPTAFPPPPPYSSSIHYNSNTANQQNVVHPPPPHLAYHHAHPPQTTLPPQSKMYHTNPLFDNDNDSGNVIPTSSFEEQQEQLPYNIHNVPSTNYTASTSSTSTTSHHHPPPQQQQQQQQQHGMALNKRTSIKFAEGTKDGSAVAPSKDIVKPNISRYHSLGTDMPDEDALKGFSWESPGIGELTSTAEGSTSSPSSSSANTAVEAASLSPTSTSTTTTTSNSFRAARARLPTVGVSTASSTIIEEDNYYYSQHQQQMDPSGYQHITSPTPYHPTLQRDHSLAINPLRHATTREPASSYRSSLDQDLVPYYHHPHPEEVYHSTYTIHRGNTSSNVIVDHHNKQQQQAPQQRSTLIIREKNSSPHSGATSDGFSPYPPSASHQRHLYNKEPYSHYPNNTASNTLEPLYYQDDVVEDHHHAQPYPEEFWPESVAQDYEQDVSRQTGYNVDHPYSSSAGYSAAVRKTAGRTPRSGERIHIPASSPTKSSSRPPPPPNTVDYHPSAASARQETSTAATVISTGANANNSTRVRRDYHERIHLASSSEHRPDYDRFRLDPPEYHPRDRSERMAASPPDDYHKNHSMNIIEPGQSPKVVVTPRSSGGPHSYAPSRARPSNHYHHHHQDSESSSSQMSFHVAPLSSSHSREEEVSKTITTNFEANSNIARPLMKRDTSHQNENPATKKETKLRRSGAEREIIQQRQRRADNLMVSSSLEESIADIQLSERSAEKQSTNNRFPKPEPISMHSRMTTLDFINDAFLLDDGSDNLSNAPDVSLLLGEDE